MTSWFAVIVAPLTAMKVGPTLAQRRYCRPDVGPMLAQPTLLSGSAFADIWDPFS